MSYIFLLAGVVFAGLFLKVLSDIRNEFVKTREMLESTNERMLLQNEQNLKNINNIYTEVAMHLKHTDDIIKTKFDEYDDQLYDVAKEAVLKAGKVSASFLQRRFGVGYSRAARLLDELEEHGIIGPGEGAKPRDVLVSE
jgi:DNA segregation ATPase FtsK/SpoIIIE-like protein